MSKGNGIASKDKVVIQSYLSDHFLALNGPDLNNCQQAA